MYKRQYWNYKYYRANYLPSLSLTSDPNLNRAINKITTVSYTHLVFDNLFAQKDCCAPAFRKIAIYRPMDRLPVLVVMPFLIAIGCKYRMFYGEDEGASRS